MATQVYPNPKCESCLHYASQAGRTGACQVNSKPLTCGDGTMPRYGYAPLTVLPPDGGNEAPTPQQVAAGGGPNEPSLTIPIVVLGEELAPLVKSLARNEDILRKSGCPAHQGSARLSGQTGMYAPVNVPCRCREFNATNVANLMLKALPRKYSMAYALDDAAEFVETLLKSMDGTDKPKRECIGKTSGNHGVCAPSASLQLVAKKMHHFRQGKSESGRERHAWERMYHHLLDQHADEHENRWQWKPSDHKEASKMHLDAASKQKKSHLRMLHEDIADRHNHHAAGSFPASKPASTY